MTHPRSKWVSWRWEGSVGDASLIHVQGRGVLTRCGCITVPMPALGCYDFKYGQDVPAELEKCPDCFERGARLVALYRMYGVSGLRSSSWLALPRERRCRDCGLGTPVGYARCTVCRALKRASEPEPEPGAVRYCPDCRADLPVSEFYHDFTRRGGGYSAQCKTHHKARAVARRREKAQREGWAA